MSQLREVDSIPVLDEQEKIEICHIRMRIQSAVHLHRTYNEA